MNNRQFLNKITESFYKYLETGSRSNKKLKILHGSIAADLKQRLGNDYKVHSLGFGDAKEVTMIGRYMPKKVDIAIEKNNQIIGAIALKFIMRNYSQNSNNYFENMLGETANIRSAGKYYFQIIILPSKVPYFDSDGDITNIEIITSHNISKYIKLSNDNINDFMHTPNKTLLYLIDFPELPKNINNNREYIDYYQKSSPLILSESKKNYKFGNAIIYNDYNEFIEKVVALILSI